MKPFGIRESTEKAKVGDFIMLQDNFFHGSKFHKNSHLPSCCWGEESLIYRITGISSDRKKFIVNNIITEPHNSLDEIVVPEFSFIIVYDNKLDININDYIKFESFVGVIESFGVYGGFNIKVCGSNGKFIRIYEINFNKTQKLSKEEYEMDISNMEIEKIDKFLGKLTEFSSIIIESFEIVKKFNLDGYFPEKLKMLNFINSIISIKDGDIEGIKNAANLANCLFDKKENYYNWYKNIQKLNDELKLITNPEFYKAGDACYVFEGEGEDSKVLFVCEDGNTKDGVILCTNENQKREFHKNPFNIFPLINENNYERIMTTINNKNEEMVAKKLEFQNKIKDIPAHDINKVEINNVQPVTEDEVLASIISSQFPIEEKIRKIKAHYKK
jgi:hypothetical protein